MKKTILTTALALTAGLAATAQVTMNIDATRRGPMTSEYQYGLFFEEINHAGEGGLYAELVKNRSFDEGTEAWTTIGGATMSIATNSLLNDIQKQALKVTTNGASATNMVGVMNKGYWGMNVVEDSTYTLSLWVRGAKAYTNNIKAQLRGSNGTTILGEATLQGNVSSTWSKLTATIKATGTDKKGQLALLTSHDSHLYIDVVSLFPYTWKGRKNGMRPDLAQLLADTKPTFLRFPGGCYVEGEGSYEQTFQWKKTIGPIEERPGHMNQNWRYWSSDGLGYDEYLQLSEDLGAAPMFVVNIGLGHGYTFSLEETKRLVQDALDAIEYANGDATTEWGAKRIANGHKEPYNLKFIEIGNENYQADPNAQSQQYAERYKMFYDAIKAKYPEIITIGNVEAWGTDNPTWRNEHPVELVDEHYYRSHSWMRQNYNKYDSYPRSIGIYVGEYAANEGGTYGTYGNMNSALGEGIFMLGMEKNSDAVKLASFAPIFTHEMDPRWPYDMIHFNSSNNFVTPSYHVQAMIANNVGSQNLLWSEVGNTVNSGTASVNIGVGSWGTAVTYDNIVVTDLNGNIIANEEFTNGMQKWSTNNGSWGVAGGEMFQNDWAENCTSVLNVPLDGNYIYKVRARKDGGNEGFLIMFDRIDSQNYAWWNLGGWNNSKHGVEICTNGGKITVADAGGWIETGRWYDIEIKVEDGKVTCKLDGSVVHEFTKPANRAIYQSVQLDNATGEMIIKIINPNSEAQTVKLNVTNMTMGETRMMRLVSASGLDENTMDAPFNVKPDNWTTIGSNLKKLDIPAFSLSIYRIKVSNVGAEVKEETAYTKEDEGKYGYLYAHMHTTEEKTCFALSTNGNYWRDLFDSKEVFPAAKFTSTGGMRDAFVYRTQNGKFMLAGTDMTSRLGWTSNHKMTFMISNDLVHWDKYISIDLESPENLKALGIANAEDMKAAWAPQIIYDPVTEKYVIYYSVGFPDMHRIYYTLIDEDLNILSEPRVFFAPGFDVIDADIVWNDIDKEYKMIFKREGDRALSMATAKTIVPSGDKQTGWCQWTLVDGFGIDEPGQAIEAPSMFRFIGQNTWKLGYQKYSNGYDYRIMSLDEHNMNPKDRNDMQGKVAAQHGSFLKLTKREYQHLENWEKVVNLMADAQKIYDITKDEAYALAVAKGKAAVNTDAGNFDANEKNMTEALEALQKVMVNVPDIKKYLLDQANAGTPTDLTPLIVNADFSESSNGWTPNPKFTAANGSVAEYYNTTFDFYQVVEGLPAGEYEITVDAFYRMGSINSALRAQNRGNYKPNATFYANGNTQPVMSLYDSSITAYTQTPYNYPDNVGMADEAFNKKDLYTNTIKLTLTEAGAIKIGIRKSEWVDSDWCCFDNFTLRYLGKGNTGIKDIKKKAK